MRYGCSASRERQLGTEDENEHLLVKTTIRTESATGRGRGLWFATGAPIYLTGCGGWTPRHFRYQRTSFRLTNASRMNGSV